MAEIPNRTLQRGFEIIELLSEAPKGLTLGEISRMLCLPKSTAFNLLRSLAYLGYILYCEETGRYRADYKLFEVGAASVRQVDTVEMIHAQMESLRETVNETLHLGVRSGRETLYIDKLDSTQSIRMSSYVGAHAPLHCTALGKAILSTWRDEEVLKLYEGAQLKQLTSHSIVDLNELLGQLAAARTSGYALEREENNENVSCVAIPLRNKTGRAVYALSISAPLFRMDEPAVARCAKFLLQAQPSMERFLKDA